MKDMELQKRIEIAVDMISEIIACPFLFDIFWI